MADPQETDPFELACWAARECAREVDTLRKVWRAAVVDAPEGYLESRIEGKFEPIVGTVSLLTCYRKRSRDVFPPVEFWVRAVRREAPATLPGTPKAASYHDTAFEMADATLWRFDTSLNWGARLLELINGPSISAVELQRIFNTQAQGSLRGQLAERLRSIHGEPYLWGELCWAMESVEAFDADDLMARIEHEAARARAEYRKENNKKPKPRKLGKWDHVWQIIQEEKAIVACGKDQKISNKHNKVCAKLIDDGKCERIDAKKVAQIRYEYTHKDRHRKQNHKKRS